MSGWYLDDITFLVDTSLVIMAVKPRDGLPTRYALMQNYPNPFNPTTVIEYHLPKADNISLMVYNIRGQVVRSLLKGRRPAGIHTFTLNVSGLASGIYFYHLEATGFSQTRKMLILK